MILFFDTMPFPRQKDVEGSHAQILPSGEVNPFQKLGEGTHEMDLFEDFEKN